MCDNSELMLGYVYDELAPEQRAMFEGHLKTCRGCRDEVAGLRGMRGVLASWTPPEPDFAFRIVRERPAAPARRWFGASPAWGLAAAAVLVLAASAAIANVEVRYDASGFAVRTGWGRTADAARPGDAGGAVPAASSGLEAKIDALAARLGEVEAARSSAGGALPASATPADAAVILRQVREMLAQSELRQTRARQAEIGQVVRDVDRARQLDLKLVEQVVAGHVRGATDQFNNILFRASQQPR